MEWYFVVWYLAATGARVSELIRIKIEHVELGYFDLYSKGGKLRRLYIPKKLKNETLAWLEDIERTSGYLFLNRYGERITTRGVSQQLKNYADKYGLDKKVVYPLSNDINIRRLISGGYYYFKMLFGGCVFSSVRPVYRECRRHQRVRRLRQTASRYRLRRWSQPHQVRRQQRIYHS